MGAYESFLFLLGSVFVPLFGVLIGHFVLSQRAGSVAAASRWSAFVSWFVGFAIYQWIAPTGPAWWLNAMDSVFGPPLAARFPWLAASIPSFVAAFILMTLITRGGNAYHSAPRQREVE
jgi:purine-cytosine permease-like protein